MNYDFKITNHQKTRGYYFDDEFKLSHYQRYNQENCYRECVADYIKKECQCTLLSLPSKSVDLKFVLNSDFKDNFVYQ
jgi:hypothetical protein